MKRNIQLDFLRFCGVALVMIHHIPILSHSPIAEFFRIIQTGGWVGVDLFFVLSGYLVSGLIIKEYNLYHSFDAKTFLIRRGFKIYPTYFLFILYQYFFSVLLTNHPDTLAGLFHESVFVANYFSFNNAHLWSISVEEHFYFFLSFAFVLLIRFGKVRLKSFLSLYLFLFVLGISFRLYNYFSFTDYDFERDYARSHIRFDSLFFGVLLSYIANYRKDIIESILRNKMKYVYLIAALAFLSTNFLFLRKDHREMAVVNLALNPICFGYLLLLILDVKNEKVLNLLRPFSYVGMFSYSIYLFHNHFQTILNKVLTVGSITYYIAYFSLAIFGGIVVSKLVEYPVIRYREKYFPSRSRHQAG